MAGGEVDLAGAITTNPSGGNFNDIVLDNTGGKLGVGGITSIVNTSLGVSGGQALSFDGVTAMTAVNLYASGGSQLLFLAATSYTGYNYGDTTIQASGTGSEIDLSHLTAFQGGGYYYNHSWEYGSFTTHVQALAGGEVDLAGAITTNPSGGNSNDFSLNGTMCQFNFEQGSCISNSLLTAANGATWTFLSGVHPTFGSGCTLTTSGTGSCFLNLATLSVSGASLAINTSAFVNQGILSAQNSGTFDFNGSFRVDGSGILAGTSGGSFNISGDLLGDATNADHYAPLATVRFDGATGAAAPQSLEVMSEDVETDVAGFNKNFVYTSVALSGTNTCVKLVNLSYNAAGTASEALYANSLIVPAGTTLDLNGLHVYVRALQLGGTVTGGTITQIPDSGPLALASPTPGATSVAGELDEWTFFGRGGRDITVVVNPGSGNAPAALSPQVNWANVQVLDASNNILASASNSSSGAVITLRNVTLPADGTYKIRINAAAGHTASTGNYMVTAWDATADVATLPLNQQRNGVIETPYSVDRCTFSADANTQVRFDLINRTSSNIVFDLTGPSGWTGFTGKSAESDLITLPSAGTYTLTAYGTGGLSGGAYAFQMQQISVTDLSLGTVYNGHFAGSAQAQLFRINVSASNPLNVVLDDAASNNVNEVYLKFGTAPTRGDYDYRYTAASAAD